MIKNFFNKNKGKTVQIEDNGHKADKGLFSQVKFNQDAPKTHQEPVLSSDPHLTDPLASQSFNQFSAPEPDQARSSAHAINLNAPENGQAEFRDQLQAQDLKQALNQHETTPEDQIYASPGEPLDPALRRQYHLQQAQEQHSSAPSEPVYYVGADAPRIKPVAPKSPEAAKAEQSEEEKPYTGPVYLIGPKKKPAEDQASDSTAKPVYYAGAFGPKMSDSQVKKEPGHSSSEPAPPTSTKSETDGPIYYAGAFGPKMSEVKSEPAAALTASEQELNEQQKVQDMMERTSKELAGIAPAPLDMLEGYGEQLESDSNYNEKTQVPRIEKLPLSLQVKLYIRQFMAAFFTHTTLNIVLPRISLNLGPCYPSSMPIPFFVLGIVIGLFPFLLQNYADTQLLSTLAFVCFSSLTGLIGYRGLVSMCAKLARRRPDTILQSAVIFLYMLTFIALFDAVVLLFPPSLSLALGFGVIFMIAACTATTLNYGLRQDLMDFYGSLSLIGLLFTVGLTVLTSYLLLTTMMATSLLGVALLFRAVVGQLLYMGHARASRSIVSGCAHLVLLLLLLDLLFFAPSLGFLRLT